ncbi:Winged helix DNA-binding protein [Venustampulla echinocandica]|uniref:Winged helix DNA-binding protein n=1 Tax=Venustampulla echinocandica TaxID=2656787 RepID=A0A370TGB6_9HELO|nr:Winged helix DNA-binding protein [Venustampulla echinocandica]RDL33946.1 Winged helix DNA-binding protein [Venustampulla echinocandica]
MPSSNSNPKKRPAPGASPAVQMAQMPLPQPYAQAAHAQMLNQDLDLLGYNQSAENTVFQDPLMYNLSNFEPDPNAAPQQQQPQLNQPTPGLSTQLARRPINRQLPQTGPNPSYDATGDPWAQFVDDSMHNQHPNPGMETDNIELLEERAAMAKRDAQAKRKQIPPFVQKLSSFLDESKNTELIRWSDRGDSFVVLDEDEFAKRLIPELFKHNNYASFVRQLNMYGFHKRVGLSDNSMKASERKNKSPSEYYNPFFKRGHPNLLWLINKPKGGSSKAKGTKRPKNDDAELDSDEEGRDGIEEIYREHMPGGQRAISQVPESGPLQKRELAVVQHQLAEIQKQQGAITHALSGLRKDHNQLFQQSLNFQQLHDRHENSINAILTFLATVYNRSLDGNGPQNFAKMFGSGIPHEQHSQGNVVEIGGPSNGTQSSPGRRQPRLLMAPPAAQARAASSATSTSASTTPNRPQHARKKSRKSGTVEELFESSPTDSTTVKSEADQQQPDMMLNIINNANAQTPPNPSGMEFPEMLSHYENANGQSPLTSEERDSMLQLMANNSSAPGTNNALVSPTPPEPPALENLELTSAEIDRLMQVHSTTGAQINDLKNIIEQPLNPPVYGSGLDDNNYMNVMESSDGHNPNVEFDQFLDPGALYGYDHLHNPNSSMGEGHFDLGMDGTTDGGIVETPCSSGAATPENNGLSDLTDDPMRSPSRKRRRR